MHKSNFKKKAQWHRGNESHYFLSWGQWRKHRHMTTCLYLLTMSRPRSYHFMVLMQGLWWQGNPLPPHGDGSEATIPGRARTTPPSPQGEQSSAASSSHGN